MADERDPKLTQHYRELGAEEPSRELDQAILAAAHRAADRPHARLVTPAGRHRWYFALGAVALLVLAVAVTVHVERQQPDPESVAPAPATPARRERTEPQAAKAPKQAPAPTAADSVGAVAGSEKRSAQAPRAMEEAELPPERWLERVALLREQGRHAEADQALAEFRKRHPDFKIPDSMLQRIERK